MPEQPAAAAAAALSTCSRRPAPVPTTKPSPEELDELREAFDYNDRDGDGLLQLDEFAQMLEDLEAETSEHETRAGFHDIDTNDDGRIDFTEFVAWWTED
jgi:calmodulin/calcium-binding protein CML/plastin-2